MSSNTQTHSDHLCLFEIAVYLLYIGDPKGIKRMTRVWASVIYESINFEYLINPLSNCGYKVELTAFFFRRCLLLMKEALSFKHFT